MILSQYDCLRCLGLLSLMSFIITALEHYFWVLVVPIHAFTSTGCIYQWNQRRPPVSTTRKVCDTAKGSISLLQRPASKDTSFSDIVSISTALESPTSGSKETKSSPRKAKEKKDEASITILTEPKSSPRKSKAKTNEASNSTLTDQKSSRPGTTAKNEASNNTLVKPKSGLRKTKVKNEASNSTLTEPQPVPINKGKQARKKKNADTATITSSGSRNNFAPNLPTHWIDPTDEIAYDEILMPTMVAKQQQKLSITGRSAGKEKTLIHTNDGIETDANTTIESGNCFTKVIPSLLRFTVRGNPRPLIRHRTGGGFLYNPSAKIQNLYRTIVLEQVITKLPTKSDSSDNSTNSPMHIPLWDIDQPIMMSILFRMKRPNSHFIGNGNQYIRSALRNDTTTLDGKAGSKSLRLRTTAPDEICSKNGPVIRMDIDNLAKFVLDSFDNVLYRNDKQIISLQVMKLYDNDPMNDYLGSTTICIRPLLSSNNATELINQMML